MLGNEFKGKIKINPLASKFFLHEVRISTANTCNYVERLYLQDNQSSNSQNLNKRLLYIIFEELT